MKKQQTTIAETLIKSGETESTAMSANKQIGDQVKSDYFKCSERFVVYQKKSYTEKKPSNDHAKLEAMTFAVTKMADVLSCQKNTNHGREKLTVPNWDGSRKNNATWKSEFNYWMEKYRLDKDEQLQRLPKNSFWANQVRPCQTIDQAWKILDTEFGDQRKLMDGLLTEITNLKTIQKPMQVYTINKPCSSAKTVSRTIVNSYPHLEAISNKLYLSGGSRGLLIGTDFLMHLLTFTLSSEVQENQ